MLLAWGLLLALLAASWQGADMRPLDLWRDAGNMAQYARGFFPPDFRDWRHCLAELVVTIGTDSGDASFASIRSLLYARNGELLVVDHRSKEVKVFDSMGAFLRRIGRTGAGPGEFADPYSLAWLGDTLALLDPGNSRIGLFGPDEKWIGQLPVQPITGTP